MPLTHFSNRIMKIKGCGVCDCVCGGEGAGWGGGGAGEVVGRG